ncbi:MAG: glycerate kinase [Blastocatellia bacterium]
MNLKSVARQIFDRTLAAIDVEAVVRAALSLNGDRLEIGGEAIDLGRYSRVLVIGIGKACVPMARAVEALLGDRITDGLVATNAIIGDAPGRLPVWIGGHPAPNEESLEAAGAALRLLRENDAEETLVLYLITGGGSAMFELPIDEGLTLDDLRTVNRVLVGCGAVISEMNLVRRHLSAVKGGRLASAAPRTRQASLYVSDVNSDDLTTVASGPTLPSDSSLDDFHRIVREYRLLEKFPRRVVELIESNAILPMPRNRPADAERRSHHLLLDNRRALAEAARIAEVDFGMRVEIANDLIEGDVETMTRVHLERLAALRVKHAGAAGQPVCLLSGGEVICPVRGRGLGGRNQEFALRAAIEIDRMGWADLAILSAGTDGIDGNSPADGAIADAGTLARARAAGVSAEHHLIESDSFTFFDRLGDAILTGPTGNNVRDLRILLARS